MRVSSSRWIAVGLLAAGVASMAWSADRMKPEAATMRAASVHPGAVLAPPPKPVPPPWQGQGDWRGHYGRGVHFMYASMYTPEVATGAHVDSDDQVRTQYVPVPYPVPVAVAPPAPPAPKVPPLVARYAIDGQSIDIPKGALVTKGTVYRYDSKGEHVYTDLPPASAHATRLFGYTEAVAPVPSARP